jgi:hypothetical protein
MESVLPTLTPRYDVCVAGVAQLVERLVPNQKVSRVRDPSPAQIRERGRANIAGMRWLHWLLRSRLLHLLRCPF